MIEENLAHVPKEGKVIVHCKSGKRSADVIELLQKKHNYQNLLNLEGGIEAWKKKYDPNLQVV
jgi:adenylyltransferase/sulfurtransferase